MVSWYLLQTSGLVEMGVELDGSGSGWSESDLVQYRVDCSLSPQKTQLASGKPVRDHVLVTTLVTPTG